MFLTTDELKPRFADRLAGSNQVDIATDARLLYHWLGHDRSVRSAERRAKEGHNAC